MADLSLDDYIVRNNTNKGFKSRLGPKVSPGRASALASQKKNTIVLKRNKPQPITFDARQKLSQRPAVQDARQKLSQKPNGGRAGSKSAPNIQGRIQIQNTGVQKRAPLQRAGVQGRIQIQNTGIPGRLPLQRAGPQSNMNMPKFNMAGKVTIRTGGPMKRPSSSPIAGPTGAKTANVAPQDMRIKIQNAQMKKMDAREKIKARQKAKNFMKSAQHQPVTAPQMTVTGLGGGFPQSGGADRPGGSTTVSMDMMGGGIQKTIGGDFFEEDYSQQEHEEGTMSSNMPLKKTITNAAAIPTMSSRRGNNIVITPTVQQYQQPQQPDHHQMAQHPPHQQQHQQHPPQQQQYTQPAYTQPAYTQPMYSQYQPSQPQQQPPQQQYTEPMPMIRITNDEYRSPEPPNPPTAAPAPPLQLSYQHNYYESEVKAAPPIRKMASRPEPSRSVAPRPVLQARLGEVASESGSSDVSPLQGYRVSITNLHTVVTQDDIVELFGAVGALKKARLLRPGTAEVVFIKKDEALAAIKKYHNRELDGQPMQVVLTTSGTPTTPKTSESSPQLRLHKSSGGGAGADNQNIDVDVGLLHKALFKTTTKEDPPTRPVTFTVKI